MARRNRNRGRSPAPLAAGENSFLDTETRASIGSAAGDEADGFEDFDAVGSFGHENKEEDINEDIISTNAPMNEDEFRSRVGNAFRLAENFVDTEIAPSRRLAADYYSSQPFGDEEDGRSHVVMSEVRDTILAIMPALMRIFTSGDKIVEFMPRTAEDIKPSEQASDAINFIFSEMNPGFTILHSAFKDALLKKLGIITWWAESEDRVIEKQFSGLMEQEVALIMQQHPELEILSAEQDGPQTYQIRVRAVDKQRKYRVRALPPECFVIDRRARDTQTQFDLIGIRDLVPLSELIEMGFDEEEILEHGQPGQDDSWNLILEERTRNRGALYPYDAVDESMRRVKYCKIYMRIDKDGDGIAELRCIHTVGNNYYVLKDEVVDHAPFAVFCPDPEPHTVYGHSIADVTSDLQKIKSHVMRATLDSLAQSIFPRTAVVEGQCNLDDVLNKEVGAVIRMRSVGAVQDLSTPFVGQPALGILQYLDEIKASRTGVTPASQGLDADLLQSTTKAAVTAQISASQERIELIARTFAETGMKQLMSGLLKLVTRHQDKPLLIRLRGEWVPIDTTEWDANMDCAVNVALGRGSDADQMNMLSSVAQKQEQIMQMLGVSNPLVKPSQYANTLSQIVRKMGFKNPESFFTAISPEMDAQLAQADAAAKANQVDPSMLLAKVEIAKAQSETFSNMEKTAISRAQMQLEQDLKRDQLDADVILKAADLAGKYGQQIDVAQIIEFISRPRPDIQKIAQDLIDSEKLASAQVLANIGANSLKPEQAQSTTQQPASARANAPATAVPQ